MHPAHDLSALASVNSNACSSFKFGSPSISNIFPLNTLILLVFSIVKRPCCIAIHGIALTTSLKVTPACKDPLKRTSTDSGMSKGMEPIAAANATTPDPPGNDMPKGKRV